MKKHVMYYLDKFGKRICYSSHSYKELKEQMLELSYTEDAGDIFYINPETNEQKVLCYYND